MKINVRVEDASFPLECAEGNQPVGWLARAACTRYCSSKGNEVLDPSAVISERLRPNDSVVVCIGPGPTAFTMDWPDRPVVQPVRRRARTTRPEIVVAAEIAEETKQWMENVDVKALGVDRLMANDLSRLSAEELGLIIDRHRARKGGLESKVARCIAPFGRDGELPFGHPEDLALVPGDVVLLDVLPPAVWWWQGTTGGVLGRFPSHYVEPSTTAHKNVSRATCAISVRAIQRPRVHTESEKEEEEEEKEETGQEKADHSVEESEERMCSFSPGDMVNIVDRRGTQWCRGMKIPDGPTGVFPVEVVEPAHVLRAIRNFGEQEVQVTAVESQEKLVGEMAGLNIGEEESGAAGEQREEQSAAVMKHVTLAPRGHPGNLEGVKADDLVTVLDSDGTSAPRYWSGRSTIDESVSGLFPSNCVEELAGDSLTQKRYRAVCDFTPAIDFEMALCRGDVVVVESTTPPIPATEDQGIISEHFWRGRAPNGKLGFFSPLHCKDAIPASPPLEGSEPEEEMEEEASETDEKEEEKEEGTSSTAPKKLLYVMTPLAPGEKPIPDMTPGQLRDESKKVEAENIRAALAPYASMIRFLFHFWRLADVDGAGIPSGVELNCAQFSAFCHEGKLVTGSLRANDVENLFVIAQSRGADKKSKFAKEVETQMGLDEFLGALVRIAHHKYRDMTWLRDRVQYFVSYELAPRAFPEYELVLEAASRMSEDKTKAVLQKHHGLMRKLFEKSMILHVPEGVTMPFQAFREVVKRWRLVGVTLAESALRAAFLYVSIVLNAQKAEVPDLDFDRFCQATAFVAQILHNNPQTPFYLHLDIFLKRNVFAVEFPDGVVEDFSHLRAEGTEKKRKKKGKGARRRA